MFKDHLESNSEELTERLEQEQGLLDLVEFDDYYLHTIIIYEPNYSGERYALGRTTK